MRDVVDGEWAEPSGEPDTVIGGDLWALPGLVDGHAHLAAEPGDYQKGDHAGIRRRAVEAMRRGVLLLLDKGWRDLAVVDMIDDTPPEQRPEIESAGLTHSVAGGYWEGFGRVIPPGEMERAVHKAVDESRGWFKLIGDWPRRGVGPVANFTIDELALAVTTAKEAGARVAIHTMAREVPSMAVSAGVHSIEHGLFLSEDDLDPLAGRNGMWVPTILQVETVIAQLGESSSGGRLLSEGLNNMARLLPLAAEAGVRILTGTDLAVGSHEVAAEARRLAGLGLSNAQVVEAVSPAGWVGTGRPANFDPGDEANAVFFPSNPLDDLGVLGHPRHVLRLGHLVR